MLAAVPIAVQHTVGPMSQVAPGVQHGNAEASSAEGLQSRGPAVDLVHDGQKYNNNAQNEGEPDAPPEERTEEAFETVGTANKIASRNGMSCLSMPE